jgi:NADH-quinone oxidoreductase subunit N
VPLELVHPDWGLIVPQLIVLGTILVVLIADLFLPRDKQSVVAWLSIIGMAAALGSLLTIDWTAGDSTFNGMFQADTFSLFINIVVLSAGILAVMISSSYVQGLEERGTMPVPEYLALVLFSILGAMLVGAAGDLLMIFIGIEMGSLAVYTLTGFARRRLTSIEGALKYFLLGAFASAILVYGMAWIYGTTGTISIPEISGQVSAIMAGEDSPEPALLLALLLLAVGLAFKIAAVPFHMWTPDAYQGAPTPVSAYMSVVPKVAGFAALGRVLAEGLGPLSDTWLILIAVLALITMVYGNVVAISQRDVKRMLAYSSIGHTGYILVGLAAYSDATPIEMSIGSLLFYLFAYTFMNIGAFSVITWLQHRGQGVDLDSFNGLGARSPLVAFSMAIFMFSLMGVPPLVGFYAKYYVILAAIEAGLVWLAIAVVLMSAVSAFFYLRVVVAMYFNDAAGEWRPQSTPLLGAGLLIMAVGTVAFGFFSGPVLELAMEWVEAFAIDV